VITGVAIKTATEFFIASKPRRHHDLIHNLNMVYPSVMHAHDVQQGFVDQDGKFYNRTEAAEHAMACGQIDWLNWPPELYSEDLW